MTKHLCFYSSMQWPVLTLLAVVFGGLATISRRVLLNGKKSLDYYSSSFLLSVTITLSLGLYAVLVEFTMPPLAPIWWVFVINVAMGVIGWLTNQRSLSLISASEHTLILSLRLIITWILSVTVMGIGLRPIEGIGSVLILAALVIMFYPSLKKKQKGISHKKQRLGIKLAALTALIYGSAILTDQIIYREAEPASYMLIGFLLTAFALLVIKPRLARSLKLLAQPRIAVGYGVAGALVALSLVLFFTALKVSDNATLVSGFGQLQIFVTVLFGAIFLGERDDLKRKFACTLLATVGAVLLVI